MRFFALLLAGCAGATHPPAPAPAPAASPAHVAPGPAFPDPQERARKLADLLPEFEAVFDEQFATRKAPGMAVALVVDGEVRWSKAWGQRDVGQNLPADLDTVFRIASLTKSFTAIAVLRLRDAGKLSLDDPAEKYLPELSPIRYPTRDSPRITVRHLLSHSAGFPEDNPWGDLQLGMSSEELQRMLSRGLAFSRAPGTAYEYSNTGFALLGRLVERVSGQRIQDYLSENVLRPLGMVATVWRQKDVPVARLALGYGRRTSAPGPQLPGEAVSTPRCAIWPATRRSSSTPGRRATTRRRARSPAPRGGRCSRPPGTPGWRSRPATRCAPGPGGTATVSARTRAATSTASSRTAEGCRGSGR